MQFNVQRSTSQRRRILILLAGFLFFSLLAFYIGGREFGVPLLLLTLLGAAYVGVDQGRLGWRYQTDEDGLRIRRTLKSYRISADSIDSIAPVKPSTIATLVKRYKTGSHPAATGNKQVALGRLVGFSSLPIPLDGSEPDPDGSYILLTLKSGRNYVLTPTDPDRFVQALRRAR